MIARAASPLLLAALTLAVISAACTAEKTIDDVATRTPAAIAPLVATRAPIPTTVPKTSTPAPLPTQPPPLVPAPRPPVVAPTSAPQPLAPAAPPPAPVANCSPSYPGVCIPPAPPDLDCGDISFRRFRVLPPDPHGFDREGDGLGCETG